MQAAVRAFRGDARTWAVQIGTLVLLGMWLGSALSAHAQPAELLVDSNVADAGIRVDGERVGQTNDDGQALIDGLRPGSRTVRVQKAGYWSASSRVTLEPELTTRVTLTLMPRPGGEGGNLLINTNVANAVVLVDGEQVGQTSPDGRAFATGLSSGPHRVVVRKSGFAPARRTVVFDDSGLDRSIQLRLLPGGPMTAGGSSDTSAASLPEPVITAGTGLPDSAVAPSSAAETSPSGAARLVVDAGVAGAQVTVNDSVYGRTGADGRLAVSTDPGLLRIAARKEDVGTAATTARLAAEERRSLSLELRPSPEPSGSLAQVGDNLLLLFFVSLAGLASVVALFIGVAGWKRGAFLRWFRDAKRFDRYDVLEVLRRSEFATVYLANDPERQRRVALKVLDDPYAGKPDHVRQFLEKGRTLQRIQEADPDAPVVDVYRVGRKDDADDGRPFIALEHLEGKTLLSVLKDVGRLDPTTAISVIRQVCVGLRAAHEVDVHHGALTPENITVTETDPEFRIRIVGFGLDPNDHSTQVLTERIAGSTAAYIAPEQLRYGEGDWRTDMYSVGMLFYKLVTGAPPYVGDSPTRILERQAEASQPDLPDHVPDHVKPVFYRMIDGDPDRRPTASRVVSVLDLIRSAA